MTNKEDIILSIEVTTYNQENFIEETLNSIINQKHKFSYEILISDDASSDRTPDIIKRFQSLYPDIIKPIFNKKNIGAMKNYYQNLKRAKGKYIMGAGGDDKWLPDKVNAQINFMENNQDFGLCYGIALTDDENNNPLTTIMNEHYADFTDLLFKRNCIPALTTCIRKSIFDTYIKKIKPHTHDWLMEDYPMWIYFAYTTNIFFINKPLGVYRILTNSVSHSVNLEKKWRFDYSIYQIRCFFANYFKLPEDQWNSENELLKTYKNFIETNSEYKKELTPYLIKYKQLEKKLSDHSLKKTIKTVITNLLPYGFIKLLKKKR